VANYSVRSDLALYVRDLATMPQDTTPYEDAAVVQINNWLSAKGYDRDTPGIPDLDATTLAALKVPACHYVLALFWGSYTHDPDLLERSKYHLKEFQRTLGEAPISLTTSGTEADDAADLSGGRLVM
jgi:peptidoglycan hydrolase-like protein with peptidoglycan-binding domain